MYYFLINSIGNNSTAAKASTLNIYAFRRARRLQFRIFGAFAGRESFKPVKSVTFAERESFRNAYLYASQNAKAAIMHIYTLRKTRKLQPVKIVTFAERESFRNAYLYASQNAKAAIMHIYTLRKTRKLQNPANTPSAERESFKTEYLYNLQGAKVVKPVFWSIRKMHLIKTKERAMVPSM